MESKQREETKIPLEVLQGFGLLAEDEIIAYGEGIIQNTYAVKRSGQAVYILQRINTQVFKYPHKIAENWKLAMAHIRQHAAEYPFVAFKETNEGRPYVEDSLGSYWRLQDFIPNSCSFTTPSGPDMLRQAAAAFGKFAAVMTTANSDTFHHIIPDFHNLELRQNQFDLAVEAAGIKRKKQAGNLIRKLTNYRQITEIYKEAVQNMPLRILHMDAKMGNILFDCNSLEFKAIIDYDTLMPAYIFSDLGDLIRSMSCTADENEIDLTKVKVRKEYLDILFNTYLAEVNEFLNDAERKYIRFAGHILVYMQALRFLTDFLQNDVYYKIAYPEHNLNRADNQAKLLEELVLVMGI